MICIRKLGVDQQPTVIAADRATAGEAKHDCWDAVLPLAFAGL
jgi:hypothetical protein